MKKLDLKWVLPQFTVFLSLPNLVTASILYCSTRNDFTLMSKEASQKSLIKTGRIKEFPKTTPNSWSRTTKSQFGKQLTFPLDNRKVKVLFLTSGHKYTLDY